MIPKARIGVLIVVAFVVAVGAIIAGQATAPKSLPPVAVRVQAQPAYGASEPMRMKVHLHNPLGGSVWVPTWQVPSDDMEADLFEVTRGGAAVEYTGILVKRPEPTARDFVEIPAGATLVAEFDPSGSYDMRLQGNYSLRYRVEDMDVRSAPPARKGAKPLVARGKGGQSAAVIVWFDGTGKALQPAARPGGPPVGGISFSGRCTTTQQTKLTTAHDNARLSSVDAANRQATGGSANLDIYRTWFGVITDARYATITGHFTKIVDAFSTKSVTYDCSCKKKNVYAYVYPNTPYVIYLCGYYWVAPPTGRDSQGGTLVHEMSHFYVVASTNDYVYGETGAVNLAISDPVKAIANADNHEYYAEAYWMK